MKTQFFYYIMLQAMLLCSCKETKYELKHKVVSTMKEVSADKYLITFQDKSSCQVDYDLAQVLSVNDTMVFKCVNGLSFNRWNCGFVEVRKGKIIAP